MYVLKRMLVTCGVSVALLFPGPAWAQHANTRSAFQLPDFAGRDHKFAYLRTRIVTAMRNGANFAHHYTIVEVGCGSGCTNNLIVDRNTGLVSNVPYGGEKQNMLTLRYRLDNNLLVASWFDGDLCVAQQAHWNGRAFEISDSPNGGPGAVCAGD